MAQEPFAQVVKRRLLGLTLIVTVAGLIALSIAIYNKAFTSTVDVQLRANHTGNQLLLDSDVKVRGIIVGSVSDIRVEGDINDPNKTVSVLTLSLDPSKVGEIPQGVSAQILPKTLFGEQYVSLDIPSNVDVTRRGSFTPIKAGDVIPQNRTKGALEAQTVLGDLYPLLTAVQPAQLNETLTAIATALQGRGEQLGRTLVNSDRYLKIINPHTKQLVDDLKKLGQVADEYNGLAQDIFASLQNLQTSARTVIERRAALDSLLTSGTKSANELESFLAENQDRLIQVTGQTAKIYPLLEEYSPEFVCLAQGINKLANLANQAIYDNQIHLTITADNTSMGKYKPGEQPRLITGLGPACFGLPNPPVPFQIPGKYRCINDGAALTSDPCAQRRSQSATATQTASVTRTAGSPQETALVKTLVAAQLHTTPNKVPGGVALLVAPMYRGEQVVVK